MCVCVCVCVCTRARADRRGAPGTEPRCGPWAPQAGARASACLEAFLAHGVMGFLHGRAGERAQPPHPQHHAARGRDAADTGPPPRVSPAAAQPRFRAYPQARNLWVETGATPPPPRGFRAYPRTRNLYVETGATPPPHAASPAMSAAALHRMQLEREHRRRLGVQQDMRVCPPTAGSPMGDGREDDLAWARAREQALLDHELDSFEMHAHMVCACARACVRACVCVCVCVCVCARARARACECACMCACSLAYAQRQPRTHNPQERERAHHEHAHARCMPSLLPQPLPGSARRHQVNRTKTQSPQPLILTPTPSNLRPLILKPNS